MSNQCWATGGTAHMDVAIQERPHPVPDDIICSRRCALMRSRRPAPAPGACGCTGPPPAPPTPPPPARTTAPLPSASVSGGPPHAGSRSPPPRRDRERSSSRDRERSRDRGRAPVRLPRSVPFLKRCANHLSPLAASSRWGWRLRAQRGGQDIRRRAELRDRRGRCPQVRRLRAVSAHHPRLV